MPCPHFVDPGDREACRCHRPRAVQSRAAPQLSPSCSPAQAPAISFLRARASPRSAAPPRPFERLVAFPGTLLLIGATMAATNVAAVAPAAASTYQHAAIDCEYSGVRRGGEFFRCLWLGIRRSRRTVRGLLLQCPWFGKSHDVLAAASQRSLPGQPEYARQVLSVRAERRATSSSTTSARSSPTRAPREGIRTSSEVSVRAGLLKEGSRGAARAPNVAR
jgi:hypothetical protein